MAHMGRYAAGLCVAGYGTLQVLGRRAGSTRQERREELAGDGTVPHPHLVTDHAITIGAPPEAVWPWLTQMGWHRAGYYTPRWVDRLLFPANLPSADVLDPALVRDLAAGDTIPDGPPGTAWFVAEQASPPGTLVLHSTTHVPASWRDRFGAAVDWTWSFRLTGLPGDRTRLHIRMRGRAAPWWLAAGFVGAIIPADFIMATGMLRGLKHRAEQASAAEVPAGPGTAVAAIKTVHTLIWLSIECCVAYLLSAGFAGRTGRHAAVVAGEVLVFAGNGFRCPRTGLADRHGAQSGSVTDLYLPRWFAHNLPAIHGPLLARITCLHVRNLRRPYPATHTGCTGGTSLSAGARQQHGNR